MDKRITIQEDTWVYLWNVKLKLRLRSLDEVIKTLKTNTKIKELK